MSEQWLSIVEYARSYNVSDMTIRRRIKTGKLQAVLREGKYYIPVRKDLASPSTVPEKVPVQVSTPPKAIKEPAPKPMRPLISHHHGPNIEQPTVAKHTAPVEQVLNTVEKALQKISQNEQRLEAQYAAKISELESQLNLKNMQIANLEQQVEDLNLLIKIIDKSSS